MTTIRDFIKNMSILKTGTIGDMVNNPKTCIGPEEITVAVKDTVGGIGASTIGAGGLISESFGVTPANDLYTVATELSGGVDYTGDRVYLGFDYGNTAVNTQPVIDRWGHLENHYHDPGFFNNAPYTEVSTRADGVGTSLTIDGGSGWNVRCDSFAKRHFVFANGFTCSWSMGSHNGSNGGPSNPFYLATDTGAYVQITFRQTYSSTWGNTRISLSIQLGGGSGTPPDFIGSQPLVVVGPWPYLAGGGHNTFFTFSFDPVSRLLRLESRYKIGLDTWELASVEWDCTGFVMPWEAAGITGDKLIIAGNGTGYERMDEYIVMDTYLDLEKREQLFDAWKDPDAYTEELRNEYNTVVQAVQPIAVAENCAPDGAIGVSTKPAVGGITPAICYPAPLFPDSNEDGLPDGYRPILTLTDAILALSPYHYWKLDSAPSTPSVDNGSAGMDLPMTLSNGQVASLRADGVGFAQSIGGFASSRLGWEGTSNPISPPDQTGDVGSGDWSIEFGFSLDFYKGYRTFFQRGDDGVDPNEFCYQLVSFSGDLYFFLQEDAPYADREAFLASGQTEWEALGFDFSGTAKQWMSIVFTKGVSLDFFIDNVLVHSEDASTWGAIKTLPVRHFTIGNKGNGAWELDGSVDEFAVHHQALDAEQRLSTYSTFIQDVYGVIPSP